MRTLSLNRSTLKNFSWMFLSLVLGGALGWIPGCSVLENRSAKTGNWSGLRGEVAKNFTAKNLDGQNVQLADFKGKVVLVNFWAVWCGPCQMEVPELVELYNTYRDKGFVVLGVSDSSDLSDIKSFIQEHKMSYPVVIDSGSVSEQYQVGGYPTSFLLDREGKLVEKYPGYSSNLRKKLETQIQKLM